MILALSAVSAAEPAPTPAQKRAGYSLPWGLRPAIAPNLVRLEETLAPQRSATTSATMLLAGYKPFAAVPDLGFYGRLAWVQHRADGAASGAALSNPIAFALYTPEVAPHLRVAGFAGVTAPIGQGGGDTPDAPTRAAASAGIYARSAMDNALFAVNYLTLTGGVGLAYVARGLTVQGEVTVLQLVRVRGAAVDPDDARTNLTSGVHVGYTFASGLVTASAELRYQRWLSTPAVVARNEATRDQATVGGGFRTNLALSRTVLARPGVSYFVPLDDPMAAAGYRMLTFDVPVTF